MCNHNETTFYMHDAHVEQDNSAGMYSNAGEEVTKSCPIPSSLFISYVMCGSTRSFDAFVVLACPDVQCRLRVGLGFR